MKKKQKYIQPTIHVIMVETEAGIAAGSATVISPDSNKQIYDEWETVPNEDRVINW